MCLFVCYISCYPSVLLFLLIFRIKVINPVRHVFTTYKLILNHTQRNTRKQYEMLLLYMALLQGMFYTLI